MPLLLATLGSLQRIEVIAIPRPVTAPLHLPQVIERANAHGQAVEVYLFRRCIENGEGRDLRKTLQDIDVPQIGGHESPISGTKKGRDRGRVKQPLANLDPASQITQNRVEQSEILGRGVGNDIDIPSAAYMTPGIDRKPTDQDKANLSLCQSLQ
jgi:hypothetical protein